MGPVDLLERERELAELDALVLDAKAGEARLALIEGPAGIGKTQLVGELRRRAEAAGLRVLSARGSELEREFPFGVVRQLFEPVLDEGAFAGAAAGARPVFAAPGDEAETGAASFSTLHGLYWLALNLAEAQPQLIAVDDLHWVDPASLRFLAYVLRRVEGVPILFAAGLRSAEAGTDPGLLAEIVHDPATVQVHPGPLSMGGIEAMVVDVLGEAPEADFCDACYQATGGNPLLLRQLLTALAAEKVRPQAAQAQLVREIGPRAVSRTVILRLARLSAQAQQVARTVAILGEGAALHAAAALAELDEATAAAATGELATAEILRHGSPLGFVHPLVRDAVYRELPPGERELQHARAAGMLKEMGAPLEQVAAHLLMTSPRGEEWVADALQEAGRAAIRKGAADSAPSYLRRALREPPPRAKRAQLLLELGIAEILTDGTSALEHLRMAYDAQTDPLTKGIAAAVLGRVVLFTGDPPGAGRLALEAAGALPPELVDLRRALEAFEACTHFFSDPDWKRLPDMTAHRTPPAPDAPVGEKALAAVAAVFWAYSGGGADECSELALAALAGGDLMRMDNGLLGIAAIRPLVIADREEAVDAWQLALAEAHRRGSIFELAGIHLWYGFTQYWRGELSDAEATLRTAMEELGRWGFGANADWYCAAFLGATLIARGDVAAAHRVLTDAPDATGRTSDGARALQHMQVALMLAEGRYEQVLPATDDLERVYGSTLNPADSPWRTFRSFALHRLGRDAEAEKVAREELELARAWGSPGTVGRVLRTLGRTRGEAGMNDIQDAIDVLEGTSARLEHARAVAALGTAIRRFGRPSDAREPLRRALELASQCDATLLVEEVRAELQTVGVRPRSDAATGIESLTPSERRVVDLAIGGGTNRDIAQELYVTPKTVEVHLSNAYRKLGVRGRRELPQVMTA
jgi:DNA-binding CsgD family transcriptional regulator